VVLSSAVGLELLAAHAEKGGYFVLVVEVLLRIPFVDPGRWTRTINGHLNGRVNG
jgi:hypothetical protein